MTGAELESGFASRGVRRGGLLMLPPADALALVRRARAEGIAVLGVDGFLLGPDSTRPVPGDTLDLSGASIPADPWSDAEAFLERRLDSGLHFEVVLGQDLTDPCP